MNDYFYNIFINQVRTLHFSRPNRIVAEEILHDDTATIGTRN